MITALGLIALVAFVIWLFRQIEQAPRRRLGSEIDWAELDEAERDVRDLDISVKPEDELPGSDWGPGTGR